MLSRRKSSGARQIALSMGFLVLLAGCDRILQGEDTVIGEPDDLPVIENTQGPLVDGPLYNLDVDLVLGVDTGEPSWQVFGTRVDLELGHEGLMFIGEEPSRTILIVGREGELLGRFGGRGSGPGEFLYKARMFWLAELQELWVEDTRLYRVSRFTADGRLVDTLKFGQDGTAFEGIRYLTGTRFLGIRLQHFEGSPDNYLSLGFLNRDLEWESDFLTLLNQRMWRASEVMSNAFPARFQMRPRVVGTQAGNIIVGNPRNGWLTLYSVDGSPILRFRRAWDLNPVTGEERAQWAEVMRKNSFPGFAKDADLPEWRPPFHAVVVDDQDRVWVQLSLSAEEEPDDMRYAYDRPGQSGFRFDIFSREGRWIGTQPLAFVPAVITSQYVYEVRSGSELEGPRIVRYRVAPLHQKTSNGEESGPKGREP